MRDYKQDVYDIQGLSHILDIPLDEFEDLEDLRRFTEVMAQNNIGVVIAAEHSNFHQGVLVEIFDKATVNEIAKKGLLNGR